MTRIAFFTLNAYNMLAGENKESGTGGAQLQQILIGKELSSRGHEIYFVEYNQDHKKEQTIDGINIVLEPKPEGNIINRTTESLIGTYDALTRINPDTCFRRVLDFIIIPLSAHSKFTNTKFVYDVAHNDELTNSPHAFTGIKTTSLYKWMNNQSLSAADSIVVRNEHQFSIAKMKFDTEIKMTTICYERKNPEPIEEIIKNDKLTALWVARFTQFKQPEIVIELADKLPDVQFIMVGSRHNEKLYENIKSMAEDRPNVDFIGFVPFKHVDRYFVSADIHLNTSSEDGFPNTFVQAWAYEKPVISMSFDPNNIISDNKIGEVGNGSVEQLASIINKFKNDQILENCSKNVFNYFQNNHSVETVADDYENILCS